MKQNKMYCCVERALRVLGVVAVGTISLVGCVNNDYDLTDLDKTVGINVTNLVVPLNLDAIEMRKIVDVDSTSKIKNIGDTLYALVHDGTFESKEINVNSFKTTEPQIDPISSELRREEFTPAASRARRNGKEVAFYKIPESSTKVNTDVTDVDKSIQEIEQIGLNNCKLNVRIVINKLNGILNTVHFENMVLQIPKGLTITQIKRDGNVDSNWSYDEKTGRLDLSKMDIQTGSDCEFTLEMTATQIQFTDQMKFDAEKHTFSLNAEGKVISGEVVIYESDFCDGKGFYDLPETTDYVCKPKMDAIDVAEFSGTIKYGIEDFDINDVTLDGIPEFLNGAGTKIHIKNPQIYVHLNNPMVQAGYKLKALSQFVLTPVWGEEEGSKLEMDKELEINEIAQLQNFCLSPLKPEKPFSEDYLNFAWNKFTSLSNVVWHETKGLPTKVKVNAVNPRIPEQKIKNFRLGRSLGKVSGTYQFYAPFQMEEGSTIMYTKDEQDWDDEALDKLVISKLKLDFDITMPEVPYDVDISVQLYEKNGEGKPVLKDAVSGTASVKDAMAKVVHVTMPMLKNGVDEIIDIRKLCGVYVAAAVKAHDGKPLSPSMKLYVTNLKATVSGTYVDEL